MAVLRVEQARADPVVLHCRPAIYVGLHADGIGVQHPGTVQHLECGLVAGLHAVGANAGHRWRLDLLGCLSRGGQGSNAQQGEGRESDTHGYSSMFLLLFPMPIGIGVVEDYGRRLHLL
ncbi:hypothetical protein D3C80_1661010 [compost metagenome]